MGSPVNDHWCTLYCVCIIAHFSIDVTVFCVVCVVASCVQPQKQCVKTFGWNLDTLSCEHCTAVLLKLRNEDVLVVYNLYASLSQLEGKGWVNETREVARKKVRRILAVLLEACWGERKQAPVDK